MKIIPLFDRVLVTEVEQQESKGGIIIPSACAEKPQIAKVVAVGNGIEESGEKVKMVLKEGDIIAYSKYAGSEITLYNQKFILIKQCDILGVIEE